MQFKKGDKVILTKVYTVDDFRFGDRYHIFFEAPLSVDGPDLRWGGNAKPDEIISADALRYEELYKALISIAGSLSVDENLPLDKLIESIESNISCLLSMEKEQDNW